MNATERDLNPQKKISFQLPIVAEKSYFPQFPIDVQKTSTKSMVLGPLKKKTLLCVCTKSEPDVF